MNTDKDGCCSCLKADYYKMGAANFIKHTKDGFKATCVMEKINVNGSRIVEKRFTSHTLNEILPYLPETDCFFDTRHKVCALLDDILPFSVTTCVSRNAQQFLKIMMNNDKIKVVGNVNPSGNGINGNVFDSEGLCPTITINKGEGLKITEPLNADDEGLCRPLKSQYYKTSKANFESHGSFGATGAKVYEPLIAASRGRDKDKLSIDGHLKTKNEQRLEVNNNGISNALTGVQKDNLVMEPHCVGYTRDSKGNVVKRHLQDYANTVHSSTGQGGNTDCLVAEPQKNPSYRIRKLTPRECFRLMGVTDSNVDTIQQSGISNCQQYKMAGNSIVVDVLENIFRKLFVDKESDDAQMSLF